MSEPMENCGAPWVPVWRKVDPNDPASDTVCQHGTAIDVHCCNCHSGFLFNADECDCEFDDEDEDDEA